MPAPEVGAQKRADEQHGRAGGADPARQQCADEQHDDVVPRRAGDGAAHVYATGHDVEPEQEHDEGYVVADDDLGELLCRDFGPVGENEGDEEQQCPRERDEQLVPFPPLGPDEREDGDGQQHAREGNDAPYGKCLAKFHRIFQSALVQSSVNYTIELAAQRKNCTSNYSNLSYRKDDLW